jgi:methionyl-tRNA synthetase
MPPKPQITYDDFTRLDFRVATVLAVEPHPNADKLLKLQIDLGDEQRQICAGIKPYCDDPQALVGKQIVVVANLAPRTIRGEESNGMLLAATEMDGEQLRDVIVLQPVRPATPGAPIS